MAGKYTQRLCTSQGVWLTPDGVVTYRERMYWNEPGSLIDNRLSRLYHIVRDRGPPWCSGMSQGAP